MKIFYLFFLVFLLSVTVKAERPKWAVKADESRFGIDYVFPNSERFQSAIWSERYAKTGAGWVNFALVNWAKIEPGPPINGRHYYNWLELDNAVKLWQEQGFHITMSLRLKNGWFAGPIKYYSGALGISEKFLAHNSDRLPHPDHLFDLKAWIEALVERYDGDGKDDMTGLSFPVCHYQVGNEYVNPVYWTGTIEDYEFYLKLVATSARKACKDVRIISNGIRWNDLFNKDKKAKNFEKNFGAFLKTLPSDQWRASWKRARKLTEFTVSLASVYDILDAGGNGPHGEGSAGYMTWVKRELAKSGVSSTIWDMESRCEPQLHTTALTRFFSDTEVSGGKNILTVLKSKWNTTNAKTMLWYRDEMARILARVFISRFAAGFEKVFMGMPDDWDKTWAALSTPNPYLGLCDGRGNPWPAYNTMRFLVRHLDGFENAEELPAASDVRLFKFSFAEKPAVYAAWLYEPQPLSLHSPVKNRTVELELDGKYLVLSIPIRKFVKEQRIESSEGSVTLNLSVTPCLFLEQKASR